MPQKPFRNIVLEVARSDPGKAARFEVPVASPTSRVLDALLHVREHLDPTLGFRYSCRAGMCGSCAVIVNGREMLACQATIADLGGDVVRVAPLRALPVLRDLVSDLAPFFASFKRVEGGLRPKEPGRSTPRTMPPGERDRAMIERHNGCLTCGACHSATGTIAGHAGPAEVNRAMMLALDERDARGKVRLGQVAADARALRSRASPDLDRICPAEIPLLEAIEAVDAMARAAGE
ncbi:MAG TPA: 2Fe-2S iron-sulfur cluster-binding protein [Usitatibacter sp.]|nr:2Fe-2S iron-sulfur cluster-binding protein [Usitatibacter sp.]